MDDGIQLILKAKELEEGKGIQLAFLSEIPFIEAEFSNGKTGADDFRNLPHPRMMKTHLPCEIWKGKLEKNPNLKIIQTVRNPKDTLVSYYHHCRNESHLGRFNGTWDQFFEVFKKKQLPWGDYFDDITECFKFFKTRENILVLPYEEMKKDQRGYVIKITKFLWYDNLSDHVIDLIVEKSKAQNMKKQVNPMFKKDSVWRKDGDFIRKATVGDWANYFSKEQNEYIDAKCKEHLKPLGLTFDYTA